MEASIRLATISGENVLRFFFRRFMREWDFAVPEPTLDERFLDLRRSVDREIADARRQAIAQIARAFDRLRSAANESEWRAAFAEAEKTFEHDPEAREVIADLAELTAPVFAGDVSAGAREVGARRFARVKIAEIQLYQAAAVKAGRAAHNLYGALKPHIDAARESFQQRFLNNGSQVADYLHAEFVRALANDDATLLGPEYPGPLTAC